MPAIKGMFHSLADWGRVLPERQDLLGELSDAILEKDAALRAAARAAVRPVRHELVIEAR